MSLSSGTLGCSTGQENGEWVFAQGVLETESNPFYDLPTTDTPRLSLMPVHRSYLICTTHRTGSTMLCQGLDHMKQCGVPDEYFLVDRGPELAKRHGVETNPKTDYLAYLKDLIESASTENGVFGAKIMWGHLDPFLERITEAHGKLRTTQKDSDWLNTVFPGLRYVWLTREDTVRQAISSWKAKQTNIYHSAVNVPSALPAKEPEYDYDQIRIIRDRFRKQNQSWIDFFAREGIEPCKVVYEDVCEDLERSVCRIMDHLEVERLEGQTMEATTLQRLADEVSEQWRERFRAEENRNQAS